PKSPSSPRVLALAPALLEASGYYSEVLVACQNGAQLTMSVGVHVFEDAGQRPLALVRLLDVSEQMRMNNELRRMHLALRNAYSLLEKQGRALDEARRAASLSLFAAGLAHEINNPVASARSNLRSLASYADDLEASWPDASSAQPEELSEIRAIAKEVEADIARLSRLVARLGELEVNVDRETFDLISECLEPLREQWKLELVAPAQLKLESDRPAIARVLAKLVDNAVYAAGPTGTVRVTVESVKDEVSIAVEDNGPGIPEKIRGLIFDPFFTTRPPGAGLGLGLFLASRMAQALGGTLAAEEAPGGGARLVLRIPQVLPEVEKPKEIYEKLRLG
ncbi:MAG TPA: HAMP domain-containing sensor histidine kinase, partial [Anaeromyxobacteraceae bacterium]|nr:HAMP domain-containing sensor histidine kinase [Anaeromyxobacteraceae bacterium]